MSAINPSHQPTPPNAHTATKRAVATLIEDMIKKSPRNIGSSEDQLNIFEKALSRVILVPGDWHTGLSKLISINKIFYDGFLEVFQKLLGWKNIGKDARKCYYQNCRLVMLVNHMLTDVMFSEYYSGNVAVILWIWWLSWLTSRAVKPSRLPRDSPFYDIARNHINGKNVRSNQLQQEG